MIMNVMIWLSFLVARCLADSYNTILTQISAKNSDCNSDGLLGNFDLTTVPQFNALCNIPVPDNKQSEFLLENNVNPILCMGLLDVSLRLCKSAKNDPTRFDDIFPPNAIKFKNIFEGFGSSNDFFLLNEFCSTTVKKYAIIEASNNETDFWWQVLNKELSDDKRCSSICHSNQGLGNKVHPLCSFILWSNAVYINYKKNQVDDGQMALVGEYQKSSGGQKNEEPIDKELQPVEVGFVKTEIQATEAVISNDEAPSLGDKSQPVDVNKSNFTTTEPVNVNKSNVTTDNHVVEAGKVDQIVNSGGESSIAKSYVNPVTEKDKPTKKGDKHKGKHGKIKEIATAVNVNGSSIVGVENINPEKTAPTGLGERKVDPGASGAAVPPSKPGASGAAELPPQPAPQAGSAATAPEPEKQQEVDPGKAAEGDLVEGDFSLEMAPEGTALDQPIAAEKEMPPPYSDEEGEDGDGDDVEIEESGNVQANTNTASNSSNPVAGKLSNSGVANVQQAPLEGDKVYGEGDILIEDHFIEAEDSHFFTYFLCMAVLTIMAYLAFHNKKKLIALAVEGRRTKGGRRRPNSSHYSKLDCSLEEALVSNTTASVTHVLY